MASDRIAGIGVRLLAAALVLVTTLSPASAPRAAEIRSEYEVKAAIIYNIINFVEWPPDKADRGELRICLAGDLPDAAHFLELHGHSAAGRRLIVTGPGGGAQVRDCSVLFLAGQDRQQLRNAVDRGRGRALLVIAEQPGAAQNGASVNLIIVNRKVRFEINAGAARESGLRISSKLLKLASIVIPGGTAGD
jgi:hypothetical protein